jgi:hypothetical protein
MGSGYRRRFEGIRSGECSCRPSSLGPVARKSPGCTHSGQPTCESSTGCNSEAAGGAWWLVFILAERCLFVSHQSLVPASLLVIRRLEPVRCVGLLGLRLRRELFTRGSGAIGCRGLLTLCMLSAGPDVGGSTCCDCLQSASIDWGFRPVDRARNRIGSAAHVPAVFRRLEDQRRDFAQPFRWRHGPLPLHPWRRNHVFTERGRQGPGRWLGPL